MTNESIKQAVREFKEESADFKSPKAEAKWGRVSDWDVSQVTSMYELFEDAREFNEDLHMWEVANVTTMYCAFRNAAAFNGDLSSWNVSKVERMTNMFAGTNGGNYDTKAKAPWVPQ